MVDFVTQLSQACEVSSITTEEASKVFTTLTVGTKGNWSRLELTDYCTANVIDSAITSDIVSITRPKYLKCSYCDCINNKDYGTCDYCGAPLKE